MKLLRLFFLYTLWMLAFSVQAQYFRKIGLLDGLPQPSVMSITQDRLGRLWFGTLEGLAVYDGNMVTSYKGHVQSADSTIWLGNNIMNLQQDKQGDIYFMSDYYLMKYELRTEQFSSLLNNEGVTTLASCNGQIWFIQKDSLFSLNSSTLKKEFYHRFHSKSTARTLLVKEDMIYAGFTNGLYILNKKTHEKQYLLGGENIECIYESSQKELWIGIHRKGFHRMTPDGKLMSYPFLNDENETDGMKSIQIRQFVEDDAQNIWIGTFDGLFFYDSKKEEFHRIRIPAKGGGLAHPSVYSLYKDCQGMIWVGTYYGGVNFFNPQKDSYAYYEYDLVAKKDLYYSYIGDMVFDDQDNLWVCTDGGGVTCITDNLNIVYQFTAGEKESLLHNNVKCIAYDSLRQSMYIGTYLGGLSRFDIKTQRFHHYLKDGQQKNHPNSVVNHMKLKNDKLFILAENGFFVLDLKTHLFKKIDVPSKYLLDVDVDDEGIVYLITWNGFIYFDIHSPETKREVKFQLEYYKSMLTGLLATNDGAYFTTLGSGVAYFDKKTKEILHFDCERGYLLSNYCYNICQTKQGNILISSDKGVTCFNLEKYLFRSINLTRIFKRNQIINNCGLVCQNGNVFVGGTSGVIVFDESEFDKSTQLEKVPDFYFNRLMVEGQTVVPGDRSGILRTSIAFTPSLRLKHNQNNLNIGFALSDYKQRIPEKSFLYKLEGLDEDWSKTNDFGVHYTNLSPGSYTLNVALLSNEKVVKSIKKQIIIASPWYATWYAWICYVLITGLLFHYIVQSRIAKRTLSLKLENERSEKLHIEQLNHEKLVFFTNVSHEFRTPLTLLISHVEILLQKHSFSPTIYNQLLKIRKNAEQMNRLISELLEFRKLTQNHLKLQVKNQNLNAFLNEVYLTFVDYAGQRKITYENHFPLEPIMCTFDERLMEKVIYNLLSNAFKFTPDGGKIILSGQLAADSILITVSDTGTGLSEKDTSRIFVRFYQGENQQEGKVMSPGTGIGLALCKVIVEKHHGTISVESQIGKGSEFIVKIPRKLEVYRSDSQIQWVDNNDVHACFKEPISVVPSCSSICLDTEAQLEGISDETEAEDKNYTVLLVEDNIELLQILKDLFSPLYQVYTATNGEDALQQVYSSKIDLIISDIMMPKMTGTEMCLQLKNNIDYCHIPIILLTALDSVERNIEGLSRGADDYVTKPFLSELLLARANNLIRSRLLIQHQFERRPISDIDLTSINPLDQDLLKRVTVIIESHIDDPQFDIPLLCQELGVSRSLIYAKFKALTGMTPNNFILNFRLKHAAILLKQYKNMPISEVSDRSGFNSPVYFSQCFKKQFGMTPNNYKKENESQE